MKTRRTVRALKIALRKKRRKKKMMTKQYSEWTTVFAHICNFLLFWKCIINQKQYRTDVEGGVVFLL
uniref:PRO2507 n=1 Tax=Homo sapiens TaxID=9606 RepID=Q9P164_HUMAN|nr:PRO2507 [Homo sapiens]